MAAPGVTALIDPLAPGIDLKPFFALMANEAVTKVFHAARQDIEIVFHLGGLIPHPVFDTQVAAMVCGFGDSVSYDQLVQKITGAQLDKSSRFTDWRHRPLSDKQLAYALADVTHLIDVYQHLKAELERENRAHWLNEEMEVLTSRETYDPHPGGRLEAPEDAAAQAAGTGRGAGRRGLARARGARAQRAARARAQGRRDLRDRPAAAARRGGAGAAADDAEGLGALGDGDRPAGGGQCGARHAEGRACRSCRSCRSRPEGSSAAAELLKVLLRLVAEKEGVAAKVLASSDDIDRIAAEGEDADVPALAWLAARGVRRQALKLVRGEIALKFEKRRLVVFEMPSSE